MYVTRVDQVDPVALGAVRRQCHDAVQWVARAARGNVPASPDSSHASLFWDESLRLLSSQPLAAGLRVGFSISDFALVRIESNSIVESYRLARAGDLEAGRWLDGLLTTVGLRAASATESPFTLAPIDDLPEIPPAAELGALEGWYTWANSVLESVYDNCRTLVPGPSPIRLWPHHFDIATLVSLEIGDPESARAIGVGMSPGDDNYAEPYFYVNPWPTLDTGDLPDLPPGGHWHRDGFVGAISTATELLARPDPSSELLAFVLEAIRVGRRALGG